ncbi:UNVERIFIED_CONTAM: hypothetical protein FKN15_037178 [Acipenser sinensis]
MGRKSCRKQQKQLSPQPAVATPLPPLPPGSPPSREIWDWLVHPEGKMEGWRDGCQDLKDLLVGLEDQGWCMACGVQGHKVVICPFQGEEEEKQQPRCYCCAEPGHPSTNCPWYPLRQLPQRCPICGGEHFIAHCPVQREEQGSPQSPPPAGGGRLLLPPPQPQVQQRPEEPENLFPWCTWCGEVDHRWRDCSEVPPSWCGRCEEGGHDWSGCPYASSAVPKREEPEHPQPKREEPERPQPKWEEPEHPQQKREEPERPQPKREEPEHPQPKREEPEHPQPKREEVRPQPKREESVRPQPKREESVRPQPKEEGVGACTVLGPKPPAEEECLLSPSPPAEGKCLLVQPQEPEGEELQSQPPENFWGGEGQDAVVPQQPPAMLLKAAQRAPAQPPQQREPALPGAEQQERPRPPPLPGAEEQELPQLPVLPLQRVRWPEPQKGELLATKKGDNFAAGDRGGGPETCSHGSSFAAGVLVARAPQEGATGYEEGGGQGTTFPRSFSAARTVPTEGVSLGAVSTSADSMASSSLATGSIAAHGPTEVSLPIPRLCSGLLGV